MSSTDIIDVTMLALIVVLYDIGLGVAMLIACILFYKLLDTIVKKIFY